MHRGNPNFTSNTQINQKQFSGQDKLYIQKPMIHSTCLCFSRVYVSFLSVFFCNKKEKESSKKEKEKLFGEVGWWFLNAI
jgi:hypothetical protein